MVTKLRTSRPSTPSAPTSPKSIAPASSAACSSVRKVRADNNFSNNTRRHEAPRDLRNTTITIRHNRPDLHFPPIVYQDGLSLGEATLLNMIANARRPDTHFWRSKLKTTNN
jgi:hypothetical protein